MKQSNRKYIKEAVGVPTDINVVAKKLYDKIIEKLKTVNVGSGDSFTITIPNKNNELSFSGLKPKKYIVDFELGSYEGDASDDKGKLEGGLIHGMGFKKDTKLNKDFILISKNGNDVNLEIDYAQPESDTEYTGQKIIDALKQRENPSISSIAHELKHAFDSFKKPTERIETRSNYSNYVSTRTGIKPMDKFIHSLYFTNKIENLVRPVEVYTEMVEDGIVKKEDFIKYLLQHKIYKTLKYLRDYSLENLKTELKSYEPQIDEYFIKHFDDTIQPTLNTLTPEKKVDLFLNHFVELLSNRILNMRKNMVEPDPFKRFMGIVGKKGTDYLEKNTSDLQSMVDNPMKFYNNSISNMNKTSNKLMKKLSKLYSLLVGDRTIKVETYDPINFELDQLVRHKRSPKSNIQTEFKWKKK